MIPKTYLQIVTLLLPCAALISWHPARAADGRCERIPASPSVTVVYDDFAVVEDYRKTVSELTALAGGATARNHNVYGLTVAEPRIDYQVTARLVTAADGSTCVAPDVLVRAGFRALTVYLASEIHDRCRLEAIREHEYEHVAVWRNHMRAGTRLFEVKLRQAFSRYRPVARAASAEAELQAWTRSELGPLEQRLYQSIEKAQASIDSSMSYDVVANRLRACPG